MVSREQINQLKNGIHYPSPLEIYYNRGKVKLRVLLSYQKGDKVVRAMISKKDTSTLTTLTFEHLEAFRKKEGRTHLFMMDVEKILDKSAEKLTNQKTA